MNITIQTCHGSEIAKHLEAIAKLRIEVFREYPYLYDGSFDYEKSYLQTYIESEKSIAILLFNESQQLVGVSTGIPLQDESEEFKKPFKNNDIYISTIFYCGESIIQKEYRGQGYYSTFFDKRENHAAQMPSIQSICFCAVQRPQNHPLKPDDYRPLDPIWEKAGYQKHPELKTTYRWKDVNEEGESDKEMVFWLKSLNKY